jgi:N6-adenosine-specific RNA methylase IME4
MWSRSNNKNASVPPPSDALIDALKLVSDTPVSVLRTVETKVLNNANNVLGLAAHADPIPKSMATFKPLPPGPFSVVVMMPPWAKRGRKLTPAAKNKTLTIHDLVHLNPVQSMMPDAVLCVWACDLRIPDAYQLGSIWGLDYAGIMFVNITIDERTKMPILKSGVFTQTSAEFMLVFTRGNPGFTVSDNMLSQIIFSKVTDPDESATVSDIDQALSIEVPTRCGPQTRYRAMSGILFHPQSTGKQHPIADDMMDQMFRNMPKLRVFADKARPGWFGYGNPVKEGTQDLVALIRQAQKTRNAYHTKRNERKDTRKRKRKPHTELDQEDSVEAIIKYRTTPGPKPKRKKPIL